MKRQLILNKRLYEKDLNEQNLYLGNKINTVKPTLKLNYTDIDLLQGKELPKGFSCKKRKYNI